MRTRTLSRDQLGSTFDTFTKQHLAVGEGATATFELLSPDYGDQLDDTPVVFLGITYDEDSDVIDLFFEDIDPMAFQPLEVNVIEDDDGFIREIQLVQDGGYRELIHVHRRHLPVHIGVSPVPMG